jgi:hypothetical protein
LTTHSEVPGADALRLALASKAPTLPSKSPLNGAAGASIVFEIRPNEVVPTYSVMLADPWKPVGHATVVDHVACVVSAPLAGLSTRSPGSEPTPASAIPAVSKPAPAVMPIIPRSAIVRRTGLAVRHLTVASRGVLGVL